LCLLCGRHLNFNGFYLSLSLILRGKQHPTNWRRFPNLGSIDSSFCLLMHSAFAPSIRIQKVQVPLPNVWLTTIEHGRFITNVQ
jgi:hypothetical protein